MFPVFPVTFTSDGRKVPLIKNWQIDASTDPNQHKLWQEQFRDRIHCWGTPTGPSTGILVLDIDKKEGRDGFHALQQQGVQVPTTLSQRTPNGGAHAFFKYPNDGHRYGNKTKLFFDGSGVDVRGDGGFASIYNLDQTAIAECPDWLKAETLKQPEAPQGAVYRIEPTIAQEIIEKSIETILEASEGSRNDTLNIESFKIGQLVRAGSITQEYANEIITEAALKIGLHPNEIRATVQSGTTGGANKPLTSPFENKPPVMIAPFQIPIPVAERWTPPYFTRRNLYDTTKLRKPQLFANWSTEDIHLTTADGGTGKTTSKLMEAICLARGDHFLGFQCLQPGKTLFITGEDTADKLGAMLGAMLRQMEASEEVVDLVMSSVLVKKDADLCIVMKDKQSMWHPNNEAMDKIEQAIEDIKPKMIVFDPISTFWGSEAGLNDMAKAVSRFMGRLVEKHNVCVEMINHMGKTSSANKDVTQFAGRGGTGLPSHARVVRVMHGIDEKNYRELTGKEMEQGTSSLKCIVNKFTDGSPLFNKPFLINRKGYLFSREDLTPQAQMEEAQKLTDIERVFRFIEETRHAGKYPSRSIIIGHFMSSGDKLSESRTKHAIDMLGFTGFEDKRVALVQGPDATQGKVYVILDSQGQEIS